MKRAKGVGRVILVAVLSILVTACEGSGRVGSGAISSNPAEAGKVQSEPVGKKLLTVMRETADDGKGFSLKDATGLGRYVYPGRAADYVACFRREVPKLHALALYAVPKEEKCPTRVGAEVPVPKVPDLTGRRLEDSLESGLMAGYNPKRLRVFKAGDHTVVPSPRPLADWRVCSQSPKQRSDFDASVDMKLYVAKQCS